jgi:hypothetical protein
MAIEFDNWGWWWGAWRGRIRCGSCGALAELEAPCPVCATDYRKSEPVTIEHNGKIIVVPQAFAGALDWSPYAMLNLTSPDQ